MHECIWRGTPSNIFVPAWTACRNGIWLASLVPVEHLFRGTARLYLWNIENYFADVAEMVIVIWASGWTCLQVEGSPIATTAGRHQVFW